ncbi:MAG TPA: DUF2304 domain-containing protein [Solirubrobacteraceae bacterium]|nr:DUF2304 domain-containing protein [Solirubrobacteraceae bacterium]
MISSNLRIVAIAGSLGLLVFVVELVRRRRLKEEYSVLWVGTALALLVLAVWGDLLRELAHLIGANSQASALYFFSILFVVFLLLNFSIRVSNLERRVVVLLQEVALLNERQRPAGADAAGEMGESAMVKRTGDLERTEGVGRTGEVKRTGGVGREAVMSASGAES